MSEAAVVIRQATVFDTPAMGRLGALLVGMHHELDAKRFMAATQQTPEGYASYLRTQLAERDVILLVAEMDGQVVGYTYAGVEGIDYMALRGPAGALYDIVVDPEHRSQRIGSRLLAETLSELKARGAPRVVLSTAERNEPAQRLFVGAGFRRTMIEMTRELD